jgi:hypothetical protein
VLRLAGPGRPADPFPNSFFWIDLNDNHKRDSLAPNNKQRQFHFQENKENQEETTTKCTTMSNFPPLFECVGGWLFAGLSAAVSISKFFPGGLENITNVSFII